jgi:hypothetical protein
MIQSLKINNYFFLPVLYSILILILSVSRNQNASVFWLLISVIGYILIAIIQPINTLLKIETIQMSITTQRLLECLDMVYIIEIRSYSSLYHCLDLEGK